MQKSHTYRLLVRITAFVLLMGVSLPAGLHAKALVDFCLTPVEQHSDMLPGHSCCPSEAESHKTDLADHATHHDCEGNVICACHIDRAPLSDQNWTITNKIFTGSLASIVKLQPENHGDFFNQSDTSSDTYSTQPIFLLNSTFLN